jgi:hypothetical protein
VIEAIAEVPSPRRKTVMPLHRLRPLHDRENEALRLRGSEVPHTSNVNANPRQPVKKEQSNKYLIFLYF